MTPKFDITNIDHWLTDQELKYPYGINGIDFERLKSRIRHSYKQGHISEIECIDMIRTVQMSQICYDRHKIDHKHRAIIHDIEQIQKNLTRDHNMTLNKDTKLFAMLTITGNKITAQTKLNLTAEEITHAIARLETHHQTELVQKHRTDNKFILTEAGQNLYNQIIDNIEEIAKKENGHDPKI